MTISVMATGSIRKSMVLTLTCFVLLQYGLLATLAAAAPVHLPRYPKFLEIGNFKDFGGPPNTPEPDENQFIGG